MSASFSVNLDTAEDDPVEAKARQRSDGSCNEEKGEGDDAHVSVVEQDWDKPVQRQVSEVVPDGVERGVECARSRGEE